MITFTLLPTCCPQEEVHREILKCIKFSTASSELLIHFFSPMVPLHQLRLFLHNPLSTPSAGAYDPNSGTPSQHSDRSLWHREGDGSTQQRVWRQRNTRVGFVVVFVKGETGFLYLFPFSALHCCHQVCPGVTASVVPEPSHWCSTKAVQVPPSTAHFAQFWLKCLCQGTNPGARPTSCTLHTKGLIKMNSSMLGLNSLGEPSQANSDL